MADSEYVTLLKKGILPEQFPYDSSIPHNFSQKYIEEEYKKVLSFGSFLPLAKSWIRELKGWIDSRRVLEIMAGPGLLSKYLASNIITSDSGSSKFFDYSKIYATVFLYAEAVDAIKSLGSLCDILLVSWPPNTNRLTKSCSIWGTIKPIIYIGSGLNCCADREFFERFKPNKIQPIKIPKWPNHPSRLLIGRWS